MPNEQENLGPLAHIGTDPDELRAIADAIVRGASIAHAEIDDLRALVDAIQAHPDAVLALRDSDEDKEPTVLTIRAGVVRSAEFSDLDIGVMLSLATTFSGVARFRRATFSGVASFDGATFSADASFAGATFSDASFADATFSGVARFDGALLTARLTGDLRRVDLRLVLFADAAREAIEQRNTENRKQESTTQAGATTSRRRPQSILGLWRDQTLGWRLVRSLGELAILNRVSLVALIAVPILAALWPGIQGAIDTYHASLDNATEGLGRASEALESAAGRAPAVLSDDGALAGLIARAQELVASAHGVIEQQVFIGWTLALTFFAALFITLGKLIYQVRSPEAIRKFDEDAFIDDIASRYPEQSAQRDDGLRRATEFLALIAHARTDRHPNLVSHHGETVWIPPKEHIEWFQDPKDPSVENPPAEPDAESAAEDGGADQKTDTPKHTPSAQLPGFVPGDERARIALEEGARAEYWLKSRGVQELDRGSAAAAKALATDDEAAQVAARLPKMALTSFTLYILGITCVFVILLLQSYEVGKAAGWWSRPKPAAIAIPEPTPENQTSNDNNTGDNAPDE